VQARGVKQERKIAGWTIEEARGGIVLCILSGSLVDHISIDINSNLKTE
jgi:hypothetical protein